MNTTIDQFDTYYKPILNRMQDSDEHQLAFVKQSLERFGKYMELLGIGIKASSDDMVQTISMVSPETDMKIFVDKNRSHNPFLQKEEFHLFE